MLMLMLVLFGELDRCTLDHENKNVKGEARHPITAHPTTNRTIFILIGCIQRRKPRRTVFQRPDISYRENFLATSMFVTSRE